MLAVHIVFPIPNRVFLYVINRLFKIIFLNSDINSKIEYAMPSRLSSKSSIHTDIECTHRVRTHAARPTQLLSISPHSECE